MTKKVAISGYYGFDNFGDETILYVLTQNLRKKYDITVLSKNPKETQQRYNVKTAQTFSLKDIFFTLLKCDILISGGGSLLQDVTSKKSLIYYLFVLGLAQLLRKKTIIFAQGIGPIQNKFLLKVTKKILAKCQLITVRDEKSLFLLRGWGLKPILVNDPVWSLEIPFATRGNAIGVQLREWDSLSDSFLHKLAAVIIDKYTTRDIILFSFQNTKDLHICEKFKTILLSINPLANIKIVQNKNVTQLLREIQSCEILVAMRFHALMLALKAGIKTIALSYDIKVQNLAIETQTPYVFLNDNEKLEKLFAEIDKYTPDKISKDFDFSIF